MGKLWFGGTIYTLQKEQETVEAIYTENNKIIKIGSKAALENEFQAVITEEVHLKGCTLFPGFVDSHIHLIGHGETLIRLDLSEYTSKEDILKKIKEQALTSNKGEWIIGEGWNENRWRNPEMIHLKELDEVAPEHPVLLKRTCRHAIIINSVAMKMANMTESTICPPGGIIEKDKKGSLTGLLKDKAQDLAQAAVPAVSEEYIEKALIKAIQHLHTLGITGVHTEDLNYYGGFDRTYKVYTKVLSESGLKFRTHLLVHHEVMEDMKKSGGGFLKGNEWIEFGAVKIFADGALGGRTALLSRPYNDEPKTQGVAIFSQQQLNELVKKARQINMPVAIHAIGDLGFEYALNAIEANPLLSEGRDRLIHAQIVRKDLIERAQKLPLILDIQPVFLASDFPWVIDRIGKENLDYCYAWKTLLSELPCAGGSDAPIESPNPMLGIHAAVTRTDFHDPLGTVYGKKEALSVYEAVCLYTKGSAYASCHERDRGIIKEGYKADFTIFDRDLFQIPASDLVDAQAMMTVIGGDIVYKRQDN